MIAPRQSNVIGVEIESAADKSHWPTELECAPPMFQLGEPLNLINWRRLIQKLPQARDARRNPPKQEKTPRNVKSSRDPPDRELREE